MQRLQLETAPPAWHEDRENINARIQ